VTKPVILSVDDDRAVLNAVDRDLRQKYGRDYRILKADSGSAALEALQELQARGELAALFIVDQRMPEMTGLEFLQQSRAIFPEARQVLLTAYADTQAAIQAINRVGLDYYLLKPWDPPEDNLYPVLDDLLDEWKANARLPFAGIRVIGAQWSQQSHEVKDFLARHLIAYHFLDVDRDPQARAIAGTNSQSPVRLPTVIMPDGTILVEPSIRELAETIGMQTKAGLTLYDLVIVGGGPAGLAASVYGASEGMRVLLVERGVPGGQAGNSPKIENYLGFPSGLSGMELARRAVTQAKRFGVEILAAQQVVAIRAQDSERIVELGDGSTVTTRAVLVSTGAKFRRLEAEGATELTGAGVYYGAAYTEAMYYQDQPVFVVGGANSAGQGAMFLSRFASKVTMLIRGETQLSSQYLQDAEAANPKIERLFNTEVVQVRGQPGKLDEIVVKDRHTGETKSLPGAAMFVFIGAVPNSDAVRDLVLCDDKGFILTGPDLLKGGQRPAGWTLDRDPLILETSVPGIFAAGDVRLGTNHRVASATGEGSIAIAAIQEYMKTV
jgi:thioredoxin reductase (NADPH)